MASVGRIRITATPHSTVKLSRFGANRWSTFLSNLNGEIADILSSLGEITRKNITTQMLSHSKKGTMAGAFGAMEGPKLIAQGIHFVGVGNIALLDAATAVKTNNPKITHGYWFNQEFGREPIQNRVKGQYVIQENPKSVIPMILYKKTNSSAYANIADPGSSRKVPRQGMRAKRSIRRGLLTSMATFKGLLDVELSDLPHVRKTGG